MSFLRRMWGRGDGQVPAACTALDIGTEFAKALVFEIDDTGHGTVRGVGRKRQGLSQLQSGTVADVAAVAASIDGYGLTSPVGFQGRHIRIGIFNAFAPLVHLGALQSVASQLDLELLEVVAEPYAVARVLGAEHVRQAGALFVDVGGGTTDVALVRQGGIEGTRMFALGGRAFTKSLADRLDLPFPRAEALKVDYASGLKVPDRKEVAAVVADDVRVWAAGVELVTEELSGGDQLPNRIYVCGGGSRLPEI